MKLTEQDMKDLWQEGAACDTAKRSGCLTDDLLLRAGMNDLTEIERQQIANHLAGCDDCTDAYRVARAANVWAKETAAGYEPKSASPVQPPFDHRLSFFDFLRFRPAQAVLAAMFLVALGIGVWAIKLRMENQNLQATLRQQHQEKELTTAKEVSQLQQNAEQLLASNQTLTSENSRLKEELDALANPQLETPIIDVDPASLTRGTAETDNAVTKIHVPASANFFTVILHLPSGYTTGAPRERLLLVELVDRKTNGVLWSSQQKHNASPNLTLTLAKNKYPAGKYRIRISEISGQRKMVIDHYDIQVSYANK